jgi:hypothetical protein
MTKAKRADRSGPAPDADKPATPATPVDLEESVAGEEDPGASLDLAIGGPVPSPTPGELPPGS